MTEQKEHPRAEFLRAIIALEPPDDWEYQHNTEGDTWRPVDCSRIGLVIFYPEDWQVRRKPRTIRIGDMDVPEPMRVAPAVGAYYWIVSVSEELLYSSAWAGDKSDFYCLERGLCQLTKKAAEQHRKALILVSGGTP